MIKIKSPFTPLFDYLTKSISRMLMLTLILALLLPIAFFVTGLKNNLWVDTHQDNLVKHQLLAESLAESIKLYVVSHQQSLNALDDQLRTLIVKDSNKNEFLSLLKNYVNTTDSVEAVSLLLADSKSVVMAAKMPNKNSPQVLTFSDQLKENSVPAYILSEKKYHIYDKENSVSSVLKSSFSKQPVFLIRHHLVNKSGAKLGTLIAEVGLGFIQQICGKIAFGNKGHCAIVDDKGRVMAHPNAAWMSQNNDLSNDELVQEMKKNRQGILEYYSSTDKEKMIGGFATIDQLGWGVMVKRPEKELDLPVTQFVINTFSWVLLGVASAFFIIMFVTRKMLYPLSVLVNKTRGLDASPDSITLGKAPKNTPAEIALLWNAISKLIASSQEAFFEIGSLKRSSNKDLHKMIIELRENNLRKPQNKDSLTGITNVACFKRELARILMVHKGEDVGIILISVEHFQSLLAAKGQNAGNLIIRHVASILDKNIRNGDMVAHFEESDQFAVYINNCDLDSLEGTAEKFNHLVESSPVLWDEEPIYINLTLGIVNHQVDDDLTLDSLLSHAKQALSDAKTGVQHKIAFYRPDPRARVA